MHSDQSGNQVPIQTKEDDGNNELAWSSFAAFINSEGDEWPTEPTENDYLRYIITIEKPDLLRDWLDFKLEAHYFSVFYSSGTSPSSGKSIKTSAPACAPPSHNSGNIT